MKNQGVWIFAEYSHHGIENVTFELLSEGRKLGSRLGEQICACLIGYQVDDYIDPLVSYGAELVYLVENEILSEYSSDAYVLVLEKLIEKHNPSLIMIGATPFGSELGLRVAARLKLPCVTEVKKLGVDKEGLLITKASYNDKVYANYSFPLLPKRTVVVTISPGEMDLEEPSTPGEAKIIKEDIEIGPGIIRTRNIRFMKGDPKTISIDEADIIVAIGRGIASKGLAMVEELAHVLGGSIGGTRAAVDDGVIPFERQIGITGKSVVPKLLIACGISGAYEFTRGIEGAEFTAAINTDRKAPIFDVVDMGLLGDVHEVIPALIQKLNKSKGLE